MRGHSQTLSSAQKRWPNSAMSDSSAACAASIRQSPMSAITEAQAVDVDRRHLELGPFKLQRCSLRSLSGRVLSL